MVIYKTLGENLRAFRLEHGANSREISHLIQCSADQYARWERGINIPTMKKYILNIEKLTGYNIKYLKRFDYSKQWERDEKIIKMIDKYRETVLKKSHDTSAKRAIKLTYKGEKLTLREWAIKLNTTYNTLWSRYNNGLSTEHILRF